MKKIIAFLVMSMLCVVAFALPRPSQIEDALASRHYAEARSMVDEVLRERPDSARAHLLNAYLLAHVDHNKVAANAELQTAVGLDKRGDVKNSALFGRVVADIDAMQTARAYAVAQKPSPAPTPRADDGPSWSLIILPGLVVGLIMYFVLRPGRKWRASAVAETSTPPARTFREAYPDPLTSRSRPAPAPAAPEPYYPPAPQSPSSSALGTVAAVAGGVVAGNAMSAMLMGGHSSHRYDDADEQRRRRAREDEEEERRRRDSWSNTYSDPSPVSTSSDRSSFSSSSSGNDSWSSSGSYDSGSSSDWGSSSSYDSGSSSSYD